MPSCPSGDLPSGLLDDLFDDIPLQWFALGYLPVKMKNTQFERHEFPDERTIRFGEGC